MSFENQNLPSPEGEQNPDLKEEIEALDEKAEVVSEQLENADLENMDPEERSRLWGSIETVMGAIIILGSAAYIGVGSYNLMTMDAKTFVDGMTKYIGPTGGGGIALGGAIAYQGITSLIKGYQKFRAAFSGEK